MAKAGPQQAPSAPWCRKRRRSASRSAALGERGAAMVEAALFLPVFLTLIVGLVELSRVVYQAVNLQFAVTKVARKAVVGAKGAETSRLLYIKKEIPRLVAAAGINLDQNEVFVCRSTETTCTAANENAGNPGEWIVIKTEKTLRIFFKNYTSTVSATVLVRNEPFTE